VELVGELRPSVLPHLLGRTRSAQRVQRSLGRRDCLAREGSGGAGGARQSSRPARHRAGVGLTAELLDATLNLARVVLRLLQVILKPLPVSILRRHRDVRLERGLELLLLAVRLVEVLDQFRVPGVGIRHRSSCLPLWVTDHLRTR
jgi:hypothetical protein